MAKTIHAEKLHQKVQKLEEGHAKLSDIKDELRIISMEYADIRSRIESTDLLIDYLTHQLDAETKMRRVTTLLILILLVMTSILVIAMSMGI